MKDFTLLFGVTLAKRFTRFQKRVFQSQLKPLLTQMGYSVQLQKQARGYDPASNLFIGDIDRAKFVVLTHFDTPARSLLPYLYFPFNIALNRKQSIRDLLLRTLIFAATIAAGLFLINPVLALPLELKLPVLTGLALLIGLGYWLLTGFANPVNFNKNSASIALLVSLAQATSKDNSICYVLLDKNADAPVGMRTLGEDKRLAAKQLIYLDSLAAGEQLVCAHGPEARIQAERLCATLGGLAVINREFDQQRLEDTLIKFFPGMLHLCVGTILNEKFIVPKVRTKEDYKVDIPRLEQIQSGLLKYLERKP